MLIGAEQTETVMTASGSDDSAFIGVRINIRRTGNLIAELSEQTVAAAEKFTDKVFAAVAPFLEAAKVARRLGLGLNAGHDLNLENLNYFYQNIPWLDEVSIGHALICDALYLGLQRTIQEYKNCLRQ